MYLLGSDRVYLVRVVAGCAWVPEEGYGHPKCLSWEKGYTSQWMTQ